MNQKDYIDLSRREAVIVAYGRSPIGKAPKGVFHSTHPVDLGAQTLKGVLARVPQLDSAQIDDVVVGCAYPEERQGWQFMDAMAVESHRRADQAQQAGLFDEEIIPVYANTDDGDRVLVTRDEGVRPGTNAEKLAQLKPCFVENGSVTAATSSQMSDGAAFVVLMSRQKAEELGVKPLARLVGFAVGGCPAEVMGIGPIYAVPKVLERTGLTLEDMEVIELNEAFASQALVCIRELGMDPERVNPNGGALALGHPLGATGAALTCKVLSQLRRNGGRYGMVTMCIGGGMGAAGIFELLNGTI